MADLIRPWSDFDHLVESLSRLQSEAQNAASKSVDAIFTARNWLIGRKAPTGPGMGTGCFPLSRSPSRPDGSVVFPSAIFAISAK